MNHDSDPPHADDLSVWLEQSNDLLATTDATGQLVWSNTAFRKATGWDGSPGWSLLTFLVPGTAGEDDRATLLRGLREGIVVAADLCLQSRDGKALWLRARAAHSAGRALWTLRDITASRALAAQAQHQAELLDMAQEFGRLGVWEREIPSGKGRWDRHVFGFWGLDPALGTPDFDLAIERIHPEDREVMSYRESTQRAGRYAQHYRVLHTDGSLRWIHSQWEVKNSPAGWPERAIGIMMDDTAIYEMARSLHDTSAQLELAAELASIAIWRHDLKTDRIHYNDRGFAMLGLAARREGLSADEVSSAIHPDDLAKVLAASRQAFRSGKPTDTEVRYRRPGADWRYVLTRRVVQRNDTGDALAFVGVALDVTEQVAQQRQASELARRLEMAAAAAGVGIWSRDPVTEAGEWNAQMFALVGRPPEQGAPSRVEWNEKIIHPDDRPKMRSARSELENSPHGMVEHEYRIVRPDGETRWLVNRARLERWGDRPMILGITLDITDRRRAEQALRDADERAAMAARSAGIGTWEVDLTDGAERWDEQMFRLRALAPRDKPPSREERLKLLHPDDRHLVLDSQRDALVTDRATSYEFRVFLPDGSVRWLASRSMPVRDEQGRTVKRVGVNWDLTESKDAEVVRQQKAMAERESQAKSQFLSRMSHELRTPLNAVLGFTQLLQIEAGHELGQSQLAKLSHIRSAGEHLLSMINDVLDLSSLESGRLVLKPQGVDLALLVAQSLPLVQGLAEQQQVGLVQGSISGTAWADATRLRQVLVNLLSNAVKYNRAHGEVTVAAGAAGGVVRLIVRDTGRGLSADQLHHLFEPFNRLGVESEGIEGTGIGLVISKALVEGMGGRIDVSSEPGVGTTFELTLPRHADVAPSATPAESQATSVQAVAHVASGGCILYIEDNPVNVTLVEELVRSRTSLHIVAEASGAAGVARARSLRPDLILLDMQLPDFDGFEVLRRLRSHAETASIRCIALSANAMPEDIERAMRAGFSDYWTKPIDFTAFLTALDALFRAKTSGAISTS